MAGVAQKTESRRQMPPTDIRRQYDPTDGHATSANAKSWRRNDWQKTVVMVVFSVKQLHPALDHGQKSQRK